MPPSRREAVSLFGAAVVPLGDPVLLAGPPAFTVRGEGDAPDADAYWIDGLTMEILGSERHVAYANTGGSIYLNRDRRTEITTVLVLHEYGHVLGYDHQSETLMDPRQGPMHAAGGPDPAETTVDICRRCADCTVIDWSNEENARDGLAHIASEYVDGTAPTMTLEAAARRLDDGTGTNIYLDTSWDGFGDVDVPDHRQLDGLLY